MGEEVGPSYRLVGVEFRVDVDCDEGCEKSGQTQHYERKWSIILLASLCTVTTTNTYLLRKWGIKRRPGMKRNAGNVMRLKMPKTTKPPKSPDANMEDRCYRQSITCSQTSCKTNLIIDNPLYNG